MPSQNNKAERYPKRDSDGQPIKLTPQQFKRTKTSKYQSYEAAKAASETEQVPANGKLRIKKLASHFSVCLFERLTKKETVTAAASESEVEKDAVEEGAEV